MEKSKQNNIIKRSKELLKQYLKDGKPHELRNEVIMLNENLIHYHVAKQLWNKHRVGYNELFNECFVSVCEFFDNKFKKQHIEYYNSCMTYAITKAIVNYRISQKCTFSREVADIIAIGESMKKYNPEFQSEDDYQAVYEMICAGECIRKTIMPNEIPSYYKKEVSIDEAIDELAEEPDYTIERSEDLWPILLDLITPYMYRMSYTRRESDGMSERERDILQMYYGIDGIDMTCEEIGYRFNLTKTRISQLKERTIHKLQRAFDNACISPCYSFASVIEQLEKW